MPEISIIIPAYNAERTIVETIQSVQQQTFDDFELIIINDGSRDKTLELIQTIQDKRLRIFSYDNAGVCAARNRGIANATGEFIAFLDADDLWTTDKLNLQLTALKQHPEAGIAYSWTCFMDVDEQEKASFLPSSPYAFSGNVYARLLVRDFVHSGSNTLVRKQAIQSVGGFDQTCPGCADWDYWLRLSVNWDFIVVPKYQILYRRTSGSMSSKVEVMRKEAMIALEKAYRSAPPELQHLKSQTLTNLNMYCASLYLQYHSDREGIQRAGQDIWSEIRSRPQNLLDLGTQKLLVKFFLKQFFPPKLANYCFQALRKTTTMVDPRLQS